MMRDHYLCQIGYLESRISEYEDKIKEEESLKNAAKADTIMCKCGNVARWYENRHDTFECKQCRDWCSHEGYDESLHYDWIGQKSEGDRLDVKQGDKK